MEEKNKTEIVSTTNALSFISAILLEFKRKIKCNCTFRRIQMNKTFTYEQKLI